MWKSPRSCGQSILRDLNLCFSFDFSDVFAQLGYLPIHVLDMVDDVLKLFPLCGCEALIGCHSFQPFDYFVAVHYSAP
jgi:hypothetical protein